MLNDIVMSKEYKNILKNEENIKIDFEVMILTSGSWPLNSNPTNYIYPENVFFHLNFNI